jgi:uncharacterized protein
MIIDQINSDLKKAMLAGDKFKVDTLKGVKTAIQYAQVAKAGVLDEDETVSVVAKEAKKRSEAAALYASSGDQSREAAELNEKKIIDEYLPQQLSEDEITHIITEIIGTNKDIDPKMIGSIIGQVKAKAGATADGSVIARLVKSYISN